MIASLEAIAIDKTEGLRKIRTESMTDLLSETLSNVSLKDDSGTPLDKLRDRARTIIEKSANPADLPDTLKDLLTQIIKPLFTKANHPSLAPSGRRLLVSQPPSLPNSFAPDQFSKKPWQNPLTIPLLTAILQTYPTLLPTTQRQTFEDHFYLLVPPILNIIDHYSPPSKISGLHLLRLLSEACISSHSSIMKRSGLTDVFIESLKANFMMLPTLMPEDESLRILGELYPAFHALVKARFIELPATTEETRFGKSSEIEMRVKYLTLLLRHGVLAGLSHLGAGGATSHVEVTTFLVGQLRVVIEALGVYAVRDLNVILPMMRGLLADPFGSSAPGLWIEAIGVLEMVIVVCRERVGEVWWGEILRGAVACWCNIIDEEEDEAPAKRKQKPQLDAVKVRLKVVAKMLGKVVEKEEWKEAKRRLIHEDDDLKELFEES